MKNKAKRKQKRAVKIHAPHEPYASLTEIASEDDRLWFEAHPGVDERIRNYRPGEFRDEVPPTDYKVIVHQIRPGVRARMIASPEDVKLAESGVWLMSPSEKKIREAAALWDEKEAGI